MPHFVLGRTAALAATLTCCFAAVAQACTKKHTSSPPTVCNTASKHSLGGSLDAQDPPVRQPANRYRHHLKPMPGHGRGLPGAASHSPSLSICGNGSDNGGSPGTSGSTTPPADGTTTPPTDTTSTPPPDSGTTGSSNVGDPLPTPPADVDSTAPTSSHGGHNHHHGACHHGGGGTTTPPTDGGTTTPPTDGGTTGPSTGGSS